MLVSPLSSEQPYRGPFVQDLLSQTLLPFCNGELRHSPFVLTQRRATYFTAAARHAKGIARSRHDAVPVVARRKSLASERTSHVALGCICRTLCERNTMDERSACAVNLSKLRLRLTKSNGASLASARLKSAAHHQSGVAQRSCDTSLPS